MTPNENATRPLAWPTPDYDPAIPVMDWALLTDSEIGERLFAAESVLTLIACAALTVAYIAQNGLPCVHFREKSGYCCVEPEFIEKP